MQIKTDKPEQNEAEKGRAFFVTVIRDDGASLFLAGPYARHSDALDKVDAAMRRAYEIDPLAHWYAYGTCQAPADTRAIFGVL